MVPCPRPAWACFVIFFRSTDLQVFIRVRSPVFLRQMSGSPRYAASHTLWISVFAFRREHMQPKFNLLSAAFQIRADTLTLSTFNLPPSAFPLAGNGCRPAPRPVRRRPHPSHLPTTCLRDTLPDIMVEVQAHGFSFEKWVRDHFFSGYLGTYMQKWDVPPDRNNHASVPAQFHNLPVSIKTAKLGSPIGLGDVLR